MISYQYFLGQIAMLMMTCGDIMAQNIEKNQMEKQVFETIDAEEESKRQSAEIKRRVTLKRYMTKPPRKLQEDEEKEEGVFIRIRDVIYEKDFVHVWRDDLSSSMQLIKSELEDIDLVRSASMGFWAGFIVTPGFILLYGVLDRYLPKQTPFAIFCRVAATVIYSVPNNTAFFAYGTCVHHAVEWYDKKCVLMQEYQQNIENGQDAELVLPDFDVEQMLETARMKIEVELVGTVVNSAKMWVPTHFVNFTVVPTHFRPFTISFVSIFWNCYLSLVQHRDLCVTDENERNP
jgi:hypothetical protein